MLTELQPFFGQLHCMSYIALLSVNTQTQAQSFFHPFLIRIVHSQWTNTITPLHIRSTESYRSMDSSWI